MPAEEGLVFHIIGATAEPWRASPEQLDELVETMGNQLDGRTEPNETALDGEGIPSEMFMQPGVEVGPERIERTLTHLAHHSRDSPPDEWDDWIRWLCQAARAGGCRSALP